MMLSTSHPQKKHQLQTENLGLVEELQKKCKFNSKFQTAKIATNISGLRYEIFSSMLQQIKLDSMD